MVDGGKACRDGGKACRDGVDGIKHREAADGWDGVDGEAADGVSVLCALCVNEAADAWCGGEAADGVDGM